MGEAAPPSPIPLAQRATAEALGTAFLVLAVVGSGIMGSRLSGGSVAVALLANSLATAAVLYALIECIGPISGAHLNPIVTFALARSGPEWRSAGVYIVAQVAGGLAGVAFANVLFGLPVLALATQVRTGHAAWLSELICSFGLIAAIALCARRARPTVSAVVAAYIGGSFWFSPTGFANPAISLARAFTDSFSGIRLADVPAFVLAQFMGAALVAVSLRLVFGSPTRAP